MSLSDTPTAIHVPRNTGGPAVAFGSALTRTWPEPPPLPARHDHAGHYQHIVLNVRTGELAFHCADWRIPNPAPAPGTDRTVWDAAYPGTGFRDHDSHQWTSPVPDVIRWTIDSGDPDVIPGRPWLATDEGDRFARSLVPLAQELVDNLYRVRDTGDLDWSAESAAAGRDIARACSRSQDAPLGVQGHPDLRNFSDAVAAFPAIVRPGWADSGNARLDQETGELAIFALSTNWHPELAALLDRAGPGDYARVTLLGVRAWGYAYRAVHAQSRIPLDATEWFSRPENSLSGRVHAGMDDDALTRFATAEQRTATESWFKLLGVRDAVIAYRDSQRAGVIRELAEVGATVEEIEQRLTRARTTRAGLLGQVIGWSDPRFGTDNDAELGRQARMTRQAVNKLRSQLTEGRSPGSR